MPAIAGFAVSTYASWSRLRRGRRATACPCRMPLMSLASVWRSLGALLRDYKAELRYCLRLTLAGLLAFGLAQFGNFPLHGLWAVLTAVVVTQMSIGGSLLATAEYVVGTLGGRDLCERDRAAPAASDDAGAHPRSGGEHRAARAFGGARSEISRRAVYGSARALHIEGVSPEPARNRRSIACSKSCSVDRAPFSSRS